MKFLICGLGSIGQRHLKNLKEIGERDIIAYRSSKKDLHLYFGEINVPMFYDLEEAFKEKPDVVFVTNPTSLHVPIALEAAKKGCHLFIEKPISSDMKGVDELIAEVETRKLTAMVGCNMRFHPGLIKIKNKLSKKELGDIYYCRVRYSSYLPDWHPWDNYKKRYSARKDLGGGIILTIIHELDYPFWFFGEAEKVTSVLNSKSYLGIDTEELAEISIRFKSGVVCQIHLDYLTKPPVRNCEIVGKKGKISWDYYDKHSVFDTNQMYIDEIKHFIECVKHKKQPLITLEQGKEVLKIALEAKDEK